MQRTPLAHAVRYALLATCALPGASLFAAEANSNELDTMVITATKQDTPQFKTANSVSVVSGQQLEDRHLDTLADVTQRLPNVYFSTFTAQTPSITIRGLGFSDDEADSTSNSVYVDGVPMNGLILGQLFDMEQVEVLRGPQNTLYGQNSMGGLVALRTRDPEFTNGGRVRLEYGSRNHQRSEATGNLALSTQTALRVTVGGEKDDGAVANSTLGKHDSAGWSSGFGRIKLLHLDDDGGEWRFGLHHMNTHGDNDYFAPRELAKKHQSDATSSGTNNTQYTLATGEYRKRYADDTQLVVNLGANQTKWDYWLPESLFSAATGYDNAESRQYTAEVRLNGKQQEWDWLVGGFLSHQRRDAPYLYDMSPYYLSDTSAKVRGDTAATFGELGWHFQPEWRLAFGLRLEHNRRRFDWKSHQAYVYDSDGDGSYDASFDSRESVRDSVNETVALPRVSLEFTPNEQHFAYAVLARGYKASGFNTYATSARTAGDAYDPEYGNYVELGYRYRDPSQIWEVSGDIFYTRLQDQQVTLEDSGGQTYVGNAGRSHNQGIELNATLRPIASLQLNAFASFVEAEFDRYERAGVDYAGKQFPSTPRHSFGASLDWAASDNLSMGTSLTRQGGSYLYPDVGLKTPAYSLWDANIDYRMGQWTVGLYGKNLGDSTYYVRGMSNGMVIAGQPRTLGVRLGLDF
ncbi:MAG: Pesticin receptor [Stenotrophomonas maltophilia]|nr:MAG: Pesticin receptor [Stenotrophomonas maltophilia]